LGSSTDLTAPKFDFRSSPESRLKSDMGPCPVRADIVAKVFLGWRTKILRAADAFYARRREGPYRFIQNRSRTSVVALKSDAAVEKSKDQLSRDFPRRSIFDFCNNICQKATSHLCPTTTAAGRAHPSNLPVILLRRWDSVTVGYIACANETLSVELGDDTPLPQVVFRVCLRALSQDEAMKGLAWA
jgi:hypothetical protein